MTIEEALAWLAEWRAQVNFAPPGRTGPEKLTVNLPEHHWSETMPVVPGRADRALVETVRALRYRMVLEGDEEAK